MVKITTFYHFIWRILTELWRAEREGIYTMQWKESAVYNSLRYGRESRRKL